MKDSSGTAAAAEAAVFPHGGKLARIGWGIECAIKWLTEIPAALLVGVETLLLLANVFYRYVLHDPLTWGDELASILFMWLAMLGAVAVAASSNSSSADNAAMAAMASAQGLAVLGVGP